MSAAAPTGSSWDEVSGTALGEIVRRFESAWRAASPSRRPDPLSYADHGPPSLTLALLRAELALRWESGEPAEAAQYAALGLTDEAMVALAYEEFCLREEHGESPRPDQFYERYPEIAKPLRRVLDIHDLVGSGHVASTASLGMGRASSVPFPEVGQTIAGFHLVEELGRGGFARVFLARERQLGDRPVALKVARSGSREPQTLARLQHTHIVPVHSYRTDPATGLHLLCMPYFGRVTLAHVLADREVKDAIHGTELVAALDRLDGEGAAGSSARTTGRLALAGRPFARAVAWWGARLAEALQHAHDRGVLHRDVKPSNVLVTADGMPMLLDFNLAHERFDPVRDDEPAALGGTVAYMSPEHLDALADGRADGGDGRSDIYALGVVLFEAMGERPFGPPPASRSVTEALRRAADQRRTRVPRLRDRFPEAPVALDAVVARCLAPDPADRYACASDLAEDLQAVADDLPLAHAREPIVLRIWAKVRRHRRAMSATAIVLVALGMAAFYAFAATMAGDRQREQATFSYERGDAEEKLDKYGSARDHFRTAERLASGSSELEPLRRKAGLRARMAEAADKTTRRVDAFLNHADAIRLALLGLDDAQADASRHPSLDSAIAPFFVLGPDDWVERDELRAIKSKRRTSLAGEVHQLLFLAALRMAESPDPSRREDAVRLCDKVAEIRRMRVAANPEAANLESLPEGPWRDLRALAQARVEGRPMPRITPPASASVATAWECAAWGYLLLASHDPEVRGRAAAWLDLAARRDSGRFPFELDAATQADRAGLNDLAFQHYSTAIDLKPDSLRARFGRGHLHRLKGAWTRARDDLQHASSLVEAKLELGLVDQAVGDFDAARAEFDAIINGSDNPVFRRAAILDRAKLDDDSGRSAQAIAAIDGLLSDDPEDAAARQARAVLALRAENPEQAESDLNRLLASTPDDPERLGLRALARLALDRLDLAREDATEAARLDPSPRRERLAARVDLALGLYTAIRFDDPQEVRALPKSGRALAPDLRAAARALGRSPYLSASRSTRAVILCALGDGEGAEAEACRAIDSAPASPRAWLVRARIRRDRGDRAGALADVLAGLAVEPDDPRLVGLLGRLKVDSGDPAEALVVLERAARKGGGPALDRPRAEARTRLGQANAAIPDWNRAIDNDPDDPTAYLGRARAFLQAANIDAALADLERAASLAEGRSDVLWAITRTYARCLSGRPNRLMRVARLATRAASLTR